MKQTGFKKGLTAAVAVSAVLGAVVVSFAAPKHGVKYTKHNLGTSGPDPLLVKGEIVPRTFKAAVDSAGGYETEICIFCHTPHNATSGRAFLWNRANNDSVAFQLYTASQTLEWSAYKSGLTLGTESRMCMTCHDGVTALNSMANPRGIQMNTYDQIGDIWTGENWGGGEEWGTNIGQGLPGVNNGTNLTNDHPVSFRYAWSLTDPTINPLDGGGMSVGGNVLPLWRDGRVECVTCHDPHINYSDWAGGDPAFRPFLRRANTSSNLCFTCHNK